jgi:hypothetical protein
VGGLVGEDPGMIGRRLPDGEQLPSQVQPGDYWKDQYGNWYAETPNGLTGFLRNHEVIEHEDGTITVSPSILVNGGRPNAWHGYLERGVWRTC